MERFPAVLIGGPPDSGKSVLTANLTQALRERGVQHYVLRACPDGEGDWTHFSALRGPQVRTLVVPRSWTPAFVDQIAHDLEHRHLPLIVDAGGRLQPWQEPILDHCTHAILLTRDPESHTIWLDLTARHGLIPVADLKSSLEGESVCQAQQPILRGTLAGLKWGSKLESPLFQALVQHLARLFAYDAGELRRLHLASAPAETAIDLDRLAKALRVPCRGKQATWEPRHLPAVLDYMPEAVPLALYGRSPNWLYAALALLAAPAPCFQFDVRLGWVQAVELRMAHPDPASPVQFECSAAAGGAHVQGILPAAFLDYGQLGSMSAPPLPSGSGVTLSGKLPLWLYTSLAITYRAAPWIAVYQPHLGSAVVVYSADRSHGVGDCLDISPPEPRPARAASSGPPART